MTDIRTVDEELVGRLRGKFVTFKEVDEAATRLSQLLQERDEARNRVERLERLVEESLFHLRLDSRAEAYHKRALVELPALTGEHNG